jgi:hypothetical protein
MSNEKNCLIPTKSEGKTFEKSRRVRIIKNLMYLISLLDFFLHYVLMIEMGAFGKILISHSTAIPLCELPIKKYLPFSLSQMSLYIFYLSIFTLLLSTEALRKSSLLLYRCHLMIKFMFVISLLFFCTIYTIVNRRANFVHTSLVIPRLENENNLFSINIETCLIYTREKMAIYILVVLNVFIFFMNMECIKVFSFLQQSSNNLRLQRKVKHYPSMIISV